MTREFRVTFGPSRLPGHKTCQLCFAVVGELQSMSHVMWHEQLFDMLRDLHNAINKNPELDRE